MVQGVWYYTPRGDKFNVGITRNLGCLIVDFVCIFISIQGQSFL